MNMNTKFEHFGVICFLSYRRTDRQNHRITDADDRYTHATIVSVSNYDDDVIIMMHSKSSKWSLIHRRRLVWL